MFAAVLIYERNISYFLLAFNTTIQNKFILAENLEPTPRGFSQA